MVIFNPALLGVNVRQLEVGVIINPEVYRSRDAVIGGLSTPEGFDIINSLLLPDRKRRMPEARSLVNPTNSASISEACDAKAFDKSSLDSSTIGVLSPIAAKQKSISVRVTKRYFIVRVGRQLGG